MWQALRSRRLCGLKFVRQQPMGAYFVDFACREAKVVIEIDGVTHTSAVEQARDDARGAFLESKGYRVVRVTNTDVYENLDGVLETVFDAVERVRDREHECDAAPYPNPLPVKNGERER